ncbi:hypothetical protein Pmani_035835 [Petrolisthes manimaculis]|uniref:Uncharacterized protein n=1 Tax=Petrolisthes manimaculis TaxID=1843537 RepID=A0AAE1NLG0_9EUCA|nr:hypothetical protein Pmani_035835 [Petrolisthes manimaculis]
MDDGYMGKGCGGVVLWFGLELRNEDMGMCVAALFKVGRGNENVEETVEESRAVMGVGVEVGEQQVNRTPREEDKSTHLAHPHEEPPTSKILSSLQGLLTFFGSSSVHLMFPLVLVFTLYLGLVLWVSSTLHRADHHLYSTISELNAKTDQISEGIAALAQIYIDNYPYTYRGRQDILTGSLEAIARQAKHSSTTSE